MEKPNFWNDGSSESVPPNGTWWGQYKYKAPNPPYPKPFPKGRAFHFLYDVVP
jgi:hypothetical protein